ncbi:hypothetical protein ZIOFF_006298 [Zingiber officinale]|uniref:GH16 domain-containing protein n=1 Tax=Zingiber officinale TaxID=94328 RepID=A0A8J5M502_ZINOF|nr:hypothetical protein ZIOFF_006298 [Zingiber officinale]
MLHGDGRTVHLSLDQRIGAAFASQDLYLHGFFSASIKLPSDYVAGVVVAFYVCFFALEFRFCSTFLYLFERRRRRRRRRRKKQKQSLLRHDGLCNSPRITLQWGCRKRLRRIKVRDKGFAAKSGVWRGIASRNVRRIADQEFRSPRTRLFIPSGNRSEVDPEKRSELAGSENHNSRSISSSPDKDDRCYTTRGSAALVCEGENADERASAASLPRFFVSLSNKEKEEDFMAMKGCKLPQRPKKRSKFVQKCILISHRREEKRIKEKKVKFHGKVVRASLFGVGAPKALVIGVVALLVFGPKGLAEASSFFEYEFLPPPAKGKLLVQIWDMTTGFGQQFLLGLITSFSSKLSNGGTPAEASDLGFASKEHTMSADILRRAFSTTEEGYLSLVTGQWAVKP